MPSGIDDENHGYRQDDNEDKETGGTADDLHFKQPRLESLLCALRHARDSTSSGFVGSDDLVVLRAVHCGGRIIERLDPWPRGDGSILRVTFCAVGPLSSSLTMTLAQPSWSRSLPSIEAAVLAWM